jgi:hypothetical protein
MEKNQSTRKSYVAPTVTRHGNAMEQTQGTCSCKAESGGFKPVENEL